MIVKSHDGKDVEILDGYINGKDIDGVLSECVLLNIAKLVRALAGESDDDLIDDVIMAKIFELAIHHRWTKLLCEWHIDFFVKYNTII